MNTNVSIFFFPFPSFPYQPLARVEWMEKYKVELEGVNWGEWAELEKAEVK